jgi:hypothetical protein
MLDGRSISARSSAIVVASATTGKDLFKLNNAGRTMTFSPDGRILLVATNGMSSTNLPRVHYYEVATGQEIFSVPIPDSVMKTAWEASGQFLATHSDSSIRVWDMRLSQVLLRKQQDFSSKALDQLWTDLASDDASRAYEANLKLSAAPDKAVALLKDRLQPAPDNTALVRRLVNDLDNGVFAIRDKASQELTKVGRGAVDCIREAASDKRHSVETKRRLQAILEGLERTALRGEELRQVRAIGVLESISSKEALVLLGSLAHGWSAAPQTLEARLQSAIRILRRPSRRRFDSSSLYRRRGRFLLGASYRRHDRSASCEVRVNRVRALDWE